jgi:hypothetical protein
MYPIVRILFWICTIVLVLILARLFYVADTSQHPIGYENDVPVYLISYADGPEIYKKNQAGLVQSSLNKGFSHFINYRKQHLSSEFKQENEEILSMKRGAGFWLWKPWVILHTLESAPENAIIVYADSGFVFKKPVQELINLAKQHDIVLIEYDDIKTYGTIEKRVQRITLDLMKADNKSMRQKPTLWAAFGVFKNNEKTRTFVKEWLLHCKDKRKITDTPHPVLKEHAGFSSHSHDQAILSILAHQNASGIYLYPDSQFNGNFVTWHHRSDRPGGKNQHISLVPSMDSMISIRYIRWVVRTFLEYATVPIKYFYRLL